MSFYSHNSYYLSKQTSLVAQTVKNLPAMQETWVHFLGWENPLEQEMATHSSILAWRIPWTEEPGRLQSIGQQIVKTRLSDFRTHIHTIRKIEMRERLTSYKRATRGNLVNTILFCILTLVENMWTYTYDKITQNQYTHTQGQRKPRKSEIGQWILKCQYPGNTVPEFCKKLLVGNWVKFT